LTTEFTLMLADFLAAAGQPAPGIHHQQSAEHPCQCEHTKHQSTDVMPVPDAAIGRNAFACPVQALNTHIKAGRCQKAAQYRSPDYDLCPPRRIHTQHTGVEPVWNSTKPGQDALAAIGMLKNLTGGAIDIQLSACTVIDGYMP